jgi:hypothetical protein
MCWETVEERGMVEGLTVVVVVVVQVAGSDIACRRKLGRTGGGGPWEVARALGSDD